MREVYRDPYLILAVDDERRLLRRTRTAHPFETLATAGETYEAAIRVQEGFDRSRYVLLVDMRLAPARNDPEFEQIVRQYYGRLYGGFKRAAALVKTQAGRLQLTRLRLNKDSEMPVYIFVDEPSALAYLETDDLPPNHSSPT